MPASDLHPPAPALALPDYDGACIANVVPALLGRPDDSRGEPAWLPESARHAHQVVLLVIDGLGWEQLAGPAGAGPDPVGGRGHRPGHHLGGPHHHRLRPHLDHHRPLARRPRAPRLPAGRRRRDPQRAAVDPGQRPGHDARRTVPARRFQPLPSFPGSAAPVPVVSKDEFGGTGFTAAHLGNSPLHGYKVPSSLPVEVGRLLGEGEPFVYAYYDGIDKVAHGSGLGDLYDAELRAVDRLVADLVGELPAGAVLVVTADHGQIDVGPGGAPRPRDHVHGPVPLRRGSVPLAPRPAGRRRRPRRGGRRALRRHHLGHGQGPAHRRGSLRRTAARRLARRLGDVALIPYAPIAFIDPADTGENRLHCRHGSLTSDELLVPLVALTEMRTSVPDDEQPDRHRPTDHRSSRVVDGGPDTRRRTSVWP